MFVYLITNTINGKRYVGQTKRTLHERWWQHTHQKNCRYLSAAINKYGYISGKIFPKQIDQNISMSLISVLKILNIFMSLQRKCIRYLSPKTFTYKKCLFRNHYDKDLLIKVNKPCIIFSKFNNSHLTLNKAFHTFDSQN